MFDYTFQWRQAFRALPQMLEGAVVTLQISLLSMALGVAIAVLLAVGRNSSSIWLRGPATAWVEVARNTPALFQIYMAHFGLGSFGIYLSPFVALVSGRVSGVVGEEMSGRVHPDAGQRAGGRDRHRRHDGRKHFTRCATDFQNLFTLSKISTCEKRFAKRKIE